MIEAKGGLKFCCVGCKGVYEILNESGLSEFYERLDKNTLNPANSGANVKNLAANFSELVTKEGEFSKISLLIDGITCSACIWLLEKALFGSPRKPLECSQRRKFSRLFAPPKALAHRKR